MYKKSKQRKARKGSSWHKATTTTEGYREATGEGPESAHNVSLKIASVALTDCVSKNVTENKSENVCTLKESSLTKEEYAQVDGEKCGTSAQLEDENLCVKLPIRPRQKRRFRRRSSTKRIGKCRRRRKFRKKPVAKKNSIPLTYQDNVEDEVFANDVCKHDKKFLCLPKNKD